MKKAFIRTTVIAAIIFTIITMILPASASDWPQFQKDNINTGNTTDIGPIYDPTAVWYKQTTGTGMGGIDVAPIVADGQVFVIDYQAIVWAYNKTTGEENWNTSCSTPGTFELSTPAYHNGILYAATSAGSAGQGYCKVTALYANNGTIRESKTLQTSHGYQLNTPITYSDNKIYLGDWNGTVTSTNGTGTYYCLNANDVTQNIWEYKATGRKTGYYWAGAAIVGNYIIFGDDTANVTCLNKNTGALVDYFNVSQQCGCSDPVERIRSSILYVESTGHIYFTAMYRDNAHGGYGTGHLYAVSFNSNTGDLGGNSAIGGGNCKWNYDLWNSKSTPVYYDGRLYVGGGYRMYQTNHTGKMCCLNASDGNLIWEWSDSYGRVKASPALSVVDGRKFIYFTTNVHNASAYCLEDMGDNYEIRWIWNPPEPDNQYILHGMAISDGIIYFGTDYGRLFALQDQIDPVLDDPDWPQFHCDIANTGNSPADAPDDNTTKWISDDIGAVVGSQAMIVDDKVFVYANDEVYGLDRSYGTVLWNTSIPGDWQSWGSWTSPAYSNDMVFVSAGSNLTRINATDGTKMQEIAFPDGGYACNGAPTVADGMVFVGSGAGNYYAFDENDLNTVVWTYTVQNNGAVSTPAVADEKVVVGELTWSGSTNLSCVNESTGLPIWVTPLPGDIGGSAAIDAANDRVYIATLVDYPGDVGTLYSINFSTGAVVWSSPITYTDSTPVISGDYIYISGSTNTPGVTYCFDQSGTLQWTVPYGSWTFSPTVADGKLFASSTAPWSGTEGIYVYDAVSGAPLWSYDHGGSPPSIANSDPILVSVGIDGKVYAIPTPPVITDVATSGITQDSVTITWTTDKNSDSLVKYGIQSGNYINNISDSSMLTAHSIKLSGLTAKTTYYFVVNSTDPDDNSAQSIEYSFTTAAVQSRSNSGGGGGGGTSGEAYNNIEVSETERRYMSSGSKTSYAFDSTGNIIKFINFTSLTNTGKISAKVEILKDTSTLVDAAAPDIVYKNLNIWVGNSGWASSKNIENPAFDLTVEKSWISDNNIDKSTIKVYKYSNDQWDPLETSITGEDGEYLYLHTTTPGFSSFAVSGKITAGGAGGAGIEPDATIDTQQGTEQATEQTSSEETPDTNGFGLIICVAVLLITVQLLYKKR